MQQALLVEQEGFAETLRDAYTGLSAREQITLKFTETYHLSYLVDSMLDDGTFWMTAEFSDYHVENGDLYAEPFDRWTALHKFVGFVAFLLMDRNFDRVSHKIYVPSGRCASSVCFASPPNLLAEDLLRDHDLGTGGISAELGRWVLAGCEGCPRPIEGEGPDWDQIWEDLLLVEGVSAALDNLAEEVFYVLFANRTFLYKFNSFMAVWLQSIDSDNPRLRRDRRDTLVLKRVSIPGWARQAVFFRDRGRCCQCGLSLASTYTAVNRESYDHMVPLAKGGLNDVTNLQLLCRSCNREKSAGCSPPSAVYERWFEARRPSLVRP